MPICKKCQTQFPNWLEINGKLRNLGKRIYCIKCSPYGRHNTRSLEKFSISNYGEKFCPRCHKNIPQNQFYDNGSGYCKKCFRNYSDDRLRKMKERCVDYKGGKCQSCGYDKCLGALEFHHKIPDVKDFQISRYRFKRFDDELVKELDKCDLLCSNCHREKHDKRI